mmetsp:Transcript_18496/g.25730  ORF Transcript_18496/g.25730 Transcript_18496/m.25730 type:complete len:125 (-) Transcript_18496:985-1359(-)
MAHEFRLVLVLSSAHLVGRKFEITRHECFQMSTKFVHQDAIDSHSNETSSNAAMSAPCLISASQAMLGLTVVETYSFHVYELICEKNLSSLNAILQKMKRRMYFAFRSEMHSACFLLDFSMLMQ